MGTPRPRRFEPLTAEEARAFLAATRGHRLSALFELALRTGLRKGELLGLRWEDLDLAGGTASIRRTLQRTNSGGLTALPTKTQSSERRIALPTPMPALPRTAPRPTAPGTRSSGGGLEGERLRLHPARRHPDRGGHPHPALQRPAPPGRPAPHPVPRSPALGGNAPPGTRRRTRRHQGALRSCPHRRDRDGVRPRPAPPPARRHRPPRKRPPQPQRAHRPTRRWRRTTPLCSTRPLTLPSTTAVRHPQSPTGIKSGGALGVCRDLSFGFRSSSIWNDPEGQTTILLIGEASPRERFD